MATSASLQAYNAINPRKAKSIREMILFTITDLQDIGATKKELEGILKLKHQTLTGQMSELQKEGKIYHRNEVKDGCTVFYATPFYKIEEYKLKEFQKTYERLLNRMKKDYQVSDRFIVDATREFAHRHGMKKPEPTKQGFAVYQNITGTEDWSIVSEMYSTIKDAEAKKNELPVVITAPYKVLKIEIYGGGRSVASPLQESITVQ